MNKDINTLPKVSVIVPVYNEEKMLPLCLYSLINLDYPKELLEIILIDNNSSDSSAAIIKTHPVIYLFEKKRGRSAARNAGIKKAAGEIIAFTDADCVVDKEWVKNLVQGFTSENIGCCSGKIFSYNPKNWIEKYFSWLQKEMLSSPVKNLEFVGSFFGNLSFFTCNLACRRKVLEEIGLFDENFVWVEDLDLVWRISLKGYQLKYTLTAVVHHKRRDKIYQIFEIFYGYAYWHYWLIKKYQPILGISNNLNLPYVMFQNIKNIIIYVFKLFKGESVYNLFQKIDATVSSIFMIYAGLEDILGRKKEFMPLLFNPAGTIWRYDYDDSIMIMKRNEKMGYKLDGIGARIWELLSEDKNINEIINIISREYAGTKEKVKEDVESMIQEFKDEKLIDGAIS